MIGYVTLGTNDLEKAAAFYDDLFAVIGVKRSIESENYFVGWGPGDDQPGIGVTRPFDGMPASVGNGVMVALAVKDKDTVHRVHRKALELGGTDEGAPGYRNAVSGFYGGYFRDLDGNKLNAFCMAPES